MERLVIFAADIIEWGSGWALVSIAVLGGAAGVAMRALLFRDKVRDDAKAVASHAEELFGDKAKDKPGLVKRMETAEKHVLDLREMLFGDEAKGLVGVQSHVQAMQRDVAEVVSMAPTKTSMTEAFEKIRAVEDLVQDNEHRMEMAMQRVQGLFVSLSQKIDLALGIKSEPIEVEPIPSLTPPHGISRPIPRQKSNAPDDFDPDKHGRR